MRRTIPQAALLFLLAVARPALAADPVHFDLTFSPKLRGEPFTGRVILYLHDDINVQPRLKHGWTSRQPIFAKNVKDWKPGEKLTISDPAGFPYELADLPKKKYAVQAVMHTNLDAPHSGTAPGNLFSKPVVVDMTSEGFDGAIALEIKKRVKPAPDKLAMPRSRIVELRSNLLSKFHHRDIMLRAAVLLPKEYDAEPDRKFPAIYVIHGFGGDHFQSAMMAAMYGKPETPFIRIGLDASCGLGHHVFADSDNNGPCGAALVEELIPHLEKEFRLIPDESARFLTGHSSGGWTSLWLQVAYPDTFGGTWSTSPDPVTFKNFCGLDLYDPATNFYKDEDGKKRPIMRQGRKIELWLEGFSKMEDVVGPGGQIHSFEAVFSPRGRDGAPRLLFDRKTGEIDQATVKAWRRYDIVEKLKREWPTLEPKLKGKLTIICGGADNFYLEGAAEILKDELESLGSDARVILVPGKDHGTIMFTEPFRKMIKEMEEKFLSTHPELAKPRPPAPEPTADE